MRGRTGLALLGAALFFASSSALGGPFDLKGTQPHDLDATNPPEDVENKCSSCHEGGTDDDGTLYSPWDTWSGTMMANAARDPLFLAALTVAEQDAAGVGTYCLRCHTPQAYVRGDATPGNGSALTDDDKQGVACEACHRSSDPSVGQNGKPAVDPNGPYAGDAQLFWDPGKMKHGPYTEPAEVSPAHMTIADPFTSSAKLCGQCHELDNPTVHQLDANGMDTMRPFPLDTTYTEWKSSAYAAAGADAKSCIDCHMPKAKGDLTLSTFPSAPTRTNPSRHAFVGGNVWGIDAVKAANPDLATERALFFDGVQADATTMLASAVKVEISTPPAVATSGASIDVGVRVTNLTGHKFPTGYADGRRAFLRLELLDAKGTAITTVGAYDDTKHALVTDPQLHVYEAVHEAHGGATPIAWHIAKSNTVVKDSRIPPKGFVAGPTTAVIGVDYGNHEYDEGTFHLAVPAGTSGELTVRATVLYQSTVAEFIDELKKANTTDDRGTTIASIYASTGFAAPIAIGKAEATVSLKGGSATGSSASGGGGGGGGSGGGSSSSGGSGKGCGCSVPGDAASASLTPMLLGAWLLLARARRKRTARS